MDLSIYVDAVMQKLKQANMYCEMEEIEVRNTIEQYFVSEYNDRVAVLQLQLDMDNAKGKMVDRDYYRQKMTEIKSYMLTLTREVGKISKD